MASYHGKHHRPSRLRPSARTALTCLAASAALLGGATAQGVVDSPAAGAAGNLATIAKAAVTHASTHAPVRTAPVTAGDIAAARPVAAEHAEAMPAAAPSRAARAAQPVARSVTSRPVKTIAHHHRAVQHTAPTVTVAQPVIDTASSGVVRVHSVLTVTHSQLVVTMRGNGHGHGMSQYGAEGAALAGLKYDRIVKFYYPHAYLVRQKTSSIRVLVSGVGGQITFVPRANSAVTGVPSVLPVTGVARYRLVANAKDGVRLQRLDAKKSAQWRTVADNLPNGAELHRTDGGANLLYRSDGDRIEYRGVMRAVRVNATGTAGGILPVNVLSLDDYTAGVVPREMPASWKPEAVKAQAVAARSYGRYAVVHPRSSAYDICDTTMCQVYGGKALYSSSGNKLWSDAMWAATGTARQVLTYNHRTIFAQFSASDGGWTVDGGQPYLIAHRDPYDNSASADPYLSYHWKVSARSLAGYYGLAKLTKIEITKRDGNGPDGGRVLAGYVTGTTSAGKARRVATTGFDLSSAIGAGTTWITVRNS